MNLWLMELNEVDSTWVPVAGSRSREAGSTTWSRAVVDAMRMQF